MSHSATKPDDSLGRVWRLALKELRETLRDRRTIVTLVLMPLLVYPLLSLGFKQLLLANMTKSDVRVWRIAAASDEEADRFRPILAQGEVVIRKQAARESSAAMARAEPTLPLKHEAGGDVSDENMPVFLTLTGGTLEEELARGQIDLGI